MAERKVHKRIAYIGLSCPVFALACGRVMNGSNYSVLTWKGVTCRRCLAQRKKVKRGKV